MKKHVLILIGLFGYSFVAAQDKGQTLQLDIGLSKHGTGDMGGFLINSEYKKGLQKGFSLSFGITATVHDGSLPIFYTTPEGNLIDASYRYLTGGLQLTSKLGISIYKNYKNEIGIQAGVLLRYQTSSYFDELNVLYPPATGLPLPVIAIINKSQQKTVSPGATGQVFYRYNLTKKMFVGATIGLQTDTNGDTITQAALSCGFKI